MRDGKPAPGVPEAEAVYDTIAESWAATRSGPWPAVTGFLGGLARGGLVVDVGAGSGRYFTVGEARGLRFVAVDISRGQLRVARRVAPSSVSLIRADGRALPLRGQVGDAALCVAVVHHLAVRGERVGCSAELARVLKPGALGLLSGWSARAEAFDGARRAEGGGPRDFIVPYKAKLGAPAERFFHAYERGELGGEAREAGLEVRREWEEGENCFVEARAAG